MEPDLAAMVLDSLGLIVADLEAADADRDDYTDQAVWRHITETASASSPT
jgi:hypothetical protein